MDRQIAVAINKQGGIWGDHFGLAPQYAIYDAQGQQIEIRVNPYGVGQPDEKEHGSPQETLDLLHDCSVFIATLTGHYPAQVQRHSVEVITITTEESDPDKVVADYLKLPPG